MRPNPLIPTRTAIALPHVKSGTTARPNVTASTVSAPARSNARAASARVAPVVKTSSTNTNAEFGMWNAESRVAGSFRIPHSAFRTSKAPAHVRQPRRRCQRRLRLGFPGADEQRDHGPTPAPAEGARQPLALVVAAVPLPGPAERDGNEARGLAPRHLEAEHRLSEVLGEIGRAHV